jgi:hypothetical protein
VILELHPHDMYDVLSVAENPRQSPMGILLNRAGTIQVHQPDGPNVMVTDWEAALAADGPHEVVKQIEAAASLPAPPQTPPSTPRTLAFRFIAATLTTAINDREPWDCRSEVEDSGSGIHRRGYLGRFPLSQPAFASLRVEGWEFNQMREFHYWALLRGEKPVALVSIDGHVYRSNRDYGLAAEYKKAGRRMLRVVASALEDVLP